MSAAMKIILLEHVDQLGDMGDVVTVKPGYARNFLLPQNKALRASKDNIAYFEAQRKTLEKANDDRKKEAQAQAKKLDGLVVTIIRHAAEGGQLYGSVAARDIAEAITEESGNKIGRGQVTINQAFKLIGLTPVTVTLHPEVKVDVIVNIARSVEEAKVQAKTGKALIVDESETLEETVKAAEAEAEPAKEAFLEEDALAAEQEKAEKDAIKAEEDAKKAEEKAAKKAAKAAEKAEEVFDEVEANAEEATEEDTAEESSAEEEKA